ncbi:MAG: 8-oxoguanine DNA glycosylase [Clostridia bacterium]|nr:8-oxoguanine DNA glycosylase [Clostridia bacterium]
MRIIENNGNLTLEQVTDFELCHVFDCGQCFRWEREGENAYFGVAFGKALLLEKQGDNLIFHGVTAEEFEKIWHGYFDFGRDYSAVKTKLGADGVMAEAIAFGEGIRILNQEPFEALISFIISASNNIPRIKGIISRLCENFGEEISYMERRCYAFPTPERLATLTLDEISVIRAGFRDKYILAAANAVADGSFDLERVRKLSTREAKTALMTLNGVGSKVSDCALLFGLGKCDSFPIDVWIKRIMEHCYFGGKETAASEIAEYAARNFGEYGGFAQQYLFYWARENKIGV